MTRPTPPPPNPYAAQVILADRVTCGAGTEVVVPVQVANPGPRPVRVVLTVLGLDAGWVPAAARLEALGSGEIAVVEMVLRPAKGALAAEYPFVVAAEATDLTEPGSRPQLSTAESVLVVNARERVNLTIIPSTPVAVFGKSFKVQLTNPSAVERDLELTTDSARGARVSLRYNQVAIPPGQTVTIPGRLTVTRPRIFGHHATHTFVVGARGVGAPAFAEGTLRSKPLIGGKVTGVIATVLVIAVWVAAAVTLIPKISNAVSSKNTVPAATSSAPGTGQSGAGQSGAGQSGAGQSGAAGQGGSGSAGSGAGGAGGSGGTSAGAGAGGTNGANGTDGTPGGSRLAGTVTSANPSGVSVSLEPTTLVRASNLGAAPAPGTNQTVAQGLRMAASSLGKIPQSAVQLSVSASDTGPRSTKTADDGSFSFAGVSAPGYYLLTLSKTGYQTQRFIVNAADLVGAQPMEVALQPGNGGMSGNVTGPDGAPIGAATITLTDGTVSLQTSTSSGTSGGGTAGSWTVSGLSTPGTYLVSASSPGFGTSSRLVTLGAGGTGTADLTVKPGVAAIVGTVSGRDSLGRLGGLGGITVTAVGTSRGQQASRTATTVTSGPIGHYQLPDLPIPGDYVVTVSGPGYATQTRSVSLADGVSSATVDVGLTSAEGVVTGTVSGQRQDHSSEGGLVGVGLTLTGNQQTFKTTTTSAPAGGFRFTGVPPGTYVLTASQYGRAPSAATVVVTAAGQATASLTLVAAPDTELPATSRIRGRVVDARTQGPLTCDRSAQANPTCILTISTRLSSGSAVSATAGPAEEYNLPGLSDSTQTGLVAGLYQVTYSAPGYESTTTAIQVGQGQVVPAAQIALQPLGMISGTVSAKVGVPAKPSCVIAVSTGSAVPSTCTVSGTTCSVSGSPAAHCALTDANGAYQVRGLIHGGYQVVVVPTDTEYRVVTPLAVQLDLAADYRYDPVLDRIGRIALTALAPNPSTLALDQAAGLPVTVTDSRGNTVGKPSGGAWVTGADGTLLVTVASGSLTVSAVSPGGTASAAQVTVADNQTVAVTLVVADQIGAVVGHLGIPVDGTERNAAGVTVTVTGVVGFNGRTPVSGTATVKTDANGCYAILPMGWPTVSAPPLTAGPCGTPVTDPAAIGVLQVAGGGASLIALPLSLNVQASGSTASFVASGALITGSGTVKQIPESLLSALPSPVGTLPATLHAAKTATYPGGTSGALDQATITVTRQPAGSGSVTAAATGASQPVSPGSGSDVFISRALDWKQDGNPVGTATPGRYTIRASLAGFADATADIWCDLARPCTFATFDNSGNLTGLTGSLVLQQLPRMTGTVAVAGGALPPGVTLADATVNVTAQPGGAGSVAATVDSTGRITIVDPSLPDGVLRPGTYAFSVALRGYNQAAYTVTCGADMTAGCGALTASLTPLPRFSGSVSLNQTPTAVADNLADLTVAVSGGSVVSGPVNTSGTSSALTWSAEPAQPAGVVVPGTYTMTFSKPGYVSQTKTFTCNATDATCGPGATAVQLTQFPIGAGTITLDQALPGATGIDWSTVAVSVSGPGGVGVVTSGVTGSLTANLLWTDTTIPGLGTIRPGTYSLAVSIPGYAASPVTITCQAGVVCAPQLDLSRRPIFAGTLTLQPTLSPLPAGATLAGATINVISQPNPSRPVVVGIADTSGTTSNLTWTDPTLPAGIVAPGTYVLQFNAPGYESAQATLTCSTGQTCTLAPVTLKMYPTAGGTVAVDQLLPGQSAVDWTKAVVTMTTRPAAAGGLSLVLNSTDATHATLQWTDGGLPYSGITWPGQYAFSISLPGYGSTGTVTLNCATGTTGACSPDLSLTRLPVFSGTLTSHSTLSSVADNDLTFVTPTITGDGTTGTGQQLSIDSTTGNLTWKDPTQPANVILPGTYQVSFVKAGYQKLTLTLNCPSGSVTCTLPAAQLEMLPNGIGTVKVDQLPASGSVDFTKATVTVNGPTGSSGLQVTLKSSSTDTTSLVWTDPTQAYPGLTVPGSYQLTVHLPGYADVTTSPFTCAAGQACDPGTITLTRQPIFSGTVVTSPSGAALPSDVLISVLPPAGGKAVTATVNTTTGAISWQESGGAPAGLVSYGTYQLSVSGTGFIGQTASFSCQSGSCPAVTLTLTQPSQLVIQTQDSSANPVNGAVFTVSGSALATTVVSAAASSNSVSFPNLSPLATYQASIQAAGWATATVNGSSSTVTCTDSGGTAHTGLAVWPGGTTTCVVTMTALGKLIGTAAGVTMDGSTVASSVSLSGAGVSVKQIDPANLNGSSTVGPTFTGTTDSNGNFTVTGTTTNQGLVPGTYLVTVTQPGYTTKSGSVTITAANAVVASTRTDALPVSSGQVAVQLLVIPVQVQVHLQVNGADALPPVSVTLTSSTVASKSWTCLITSGGNPTCTAGGTNPSIVVVNGSQPAKYVRITGVDPGLYTLIITSPTNSYRSVNAQAQIQVGVPVQSLFPSLDARSSTQTGTIKLANNNAAPAGTTVTLRPENNVAVVATDANGDPLSTTTDSSGKFTFTLVPDGRYLLVAELAGYAPAQYGSTVVLDSSASGSPPALTLKLTTRAVRPVTITITPPDPAISLVGQQITLTSGNTIAGLSADSPLTAPLTAAGSGSFTATFAQVGTGSWTAAIATAPSSSTPSLPFGATLSSTAVSVPELQVGVTPTSVPVTLTLTGTVTTLAYHWATSCDNTAPTNLQISLTKAPGTGTASTVTLTTTTGQNDATATVLLPAAAYSYALGGLPTGWTTTASTALDLSAAPSTSTPTAVTVTPAAVVVTVGASIASGHLPTGLTVSATNGTTTLTSTALGDGTTSSGTATLCLTRGVAWTFTLLGSTTAASLPTATLTPTAGGTNQVTFDTRSVTPTVTLQNIAGRDYATDPARSIDVTITGGATGPLTQTVAIAAGATSGTGTAVLLGTAGSTAYKLSATAPADGIFGAVTDQDLDQTGSTLVLPYARSFLTVTASGTIAPTATPTVVVTSTTNSAITFTEPLSAGQTAVFPDLVPGTYDIKVMDGTTELGSSSAVTLAVGVIAETVTLA